jgi:hypothetical protein
MRARATERALRRLRELESRRAAVVDELGQPDALIVGSFSEVARRCGTPSCHCADGPGHVQAILMSVKDGRRRCQLVRQADLADVRPAVARYRAFRAGVRRLTSLDLKILALLKQLMGLRDQGYK